MNTQEPALHCPDCGPTAVTIPTCDSGVCTSCRGRRTIDCVACFPDHVAAVEEIDDEPLCRACALETLEQSSSLAQMRDALNEDDPPFVKALDRALALHQMRRDDRECGT